MFQIDNIAKSCYMSELLFKLGSGDYRTMREFFAIRVERTAKNSDGSAMTVAVIRNADVSAAQNFRAERALVR
jgi:hypothetical protein